MSVNFGKYAILAPITHYFEQDEELFWMIKPINSGMELERSKFMLHNRIIEDRGGVRHEMPPSWLEVAYREIALCFGGTNLVDSEGKKVLEDEATAIQVEEILKQMPQEMVMEIWKVIGQSYPKWGPVDPNAL